MPEASTADLTQLIRDLNDYEPALVDMIRAQTPADNKAWQEVHGYKTSEELLHQMTFALFIVRGVCWCHACLPVRYRKNHPAIPFLNEAAKGIEEKTISWSSCCHERTLGI